MILVNVKSLANPGGRDERFRKRDAVVRKFET